MAKKCSPTRLLAIAAITAASGVTCSRKNQGPILVSGTGRTAIAIEHVAVFIDGKKVYSAQLPWAIDEHLSNCISRRVLGWQFPVASEPTRIDLPFVFAEPQ